jgi:thioester reductase-like protein
VELGEIEAALREGAGVAQAVVVVREDEPGERRLVAYVTGEGVDAEGLRAALQAELPDYMTPAAIVVLESIPLNANGKVDRKALPEPEYTRREWRAPRTPQEEILCSLFAETLGLDRVGIDDNFFVLGGDSLTSIRLVSRCRSEGIVLTPRDVFLYQTVEQIAAASTKQGSLPRLDLPSQVTLPAGVRPARRRAKPSGPGQLLLTGATGFFGAHLLAELLKATEATVHCLVRTDSPADGVRRVQASFERFGLPTGGIDERIRVIPGDLSMPLLDLPEVEFRNLAAGIDAIYHCAATVNSLYSYDILKNVNVDGTRTIVRLACTASTKPLHFVSTISVFPVNHRGWPEPRADKDIGNAWPHLQTGYARSKWVAESIVALARDRGLPVTIYRPSLISGSTTTGLLNPADFLSLLLHACLTLELIPDIDMELNLIPVDFASKALVTISRTRSRRRSHNLVNSESISFRRVAEWILELCPATRVVPYALWRSRITEQPRHAALLAFFPDSPIQPQRAPRRRRTEPPRPGRVASYRDFSLTCPAMTQGLLKRYLDSFSQRPPVPKTIGR